MTPPTPHQYPAYKPSDVPWLGDLPEHWDVVPTRALLSLKKQLVGDRADKYTLLSLTKQGIIARDMENPEGKFPASFETYQVVEPGDLVFCLFDIDETPRTIGLSSMTGMITGAYTRFVCPNEQNRRFIYQLYLSLDNGKLLKPLYSGLRKVITKSTFLSATIPLPPLHEQAAIVRYLDHADRRIRRYVDAKRKLIGLLEEEKQVIINQAVTRGLDPNVPLKPSGVEWLGDVPEHWEVRRVKSLSLVKRGASPRPIDDPRYFDDNGEYAWVRIVDVTASNRYLERTTQRLSELGHFLSVRLEPGALFLSIAGSVGKPIITRIRCCIHDGFVYFPQYNGNVEFLYRVFSCHAPFARLGKLGTQLNLNTDTVGDIHLGWPPLREQTSIVEYLEKATFAIDSAITLTHRQIELLQEYRTRLIADVVTGKLDVREAAAQLPDEPDDQDQLQEGGPLAEGMDEDLHAPGEFAEELAMPSNMP